MRVCQIAGCGRAHKARGHCEVHARRLRLFGSTQSDKPVRPQSAGRCTIESCQSVAKGKGLCGKHRYRFQKYGDANVCKFEHSSHRRAWHVEKREGYVVRYAPDSIHAGSSGYEYQHRVVMGEMLGRRLLPSETAHHINGVRTDNRPENLELWVSSQPAGQRASDLVAWAKEVLELYSAVPLLLAEKTPTHTLRRPQARRAA